MVKNNTPVQVVVKLVVAVAVGVAVSALVHVLGGSALVNVPVAGLITGVLFVFLLQGSPLAKKDGRGGEG